MTVRGERDVGVDRVGFVETNDVDEHVERGDRAEARRDLSETDEKALRGERDPCLRRRGVCCIGS